MQIAVHHLAPSMLSQNSHTPLARLNDNPNVMLTPSIATCKHKRARQFTVSYSEVQEVDPSGKVREVIIIDDTPPPSTISPATTHTALYSASYQPPVYSAPVRTRARAAAEAQALSASSLSAIVQPLLKKRKRDPAEDAGILSKKAVNGHLQNAIDANKSWASGGAAAPDDVCTLSLSALGRRDGFRPGIQGAGLLR